jgi:hypothetical protein
MAGRLGREGVYHYEDVPQSIACAYCIYGCGRRGCTRERRCRSSPQTSPWPQEVGFPHQRNGPGRVPGLFACAGGEEKWGDEVREAGPDADRID